jgi:hypothetical protein
VERFRKDSGIQYWWKNIGRKNYKKSKKLLICADAGGSNSYRSRLWKKKIQDFCNAAK